MRDLEDGIYLAGSALWTVVRHVLAIGAIVAVVEGVAVLLYLATLMTALSTGSGLGGIGFLPMTVLVLGVLLTLLWIVVLVPATAVAWWFGRALALGGLARLGIGMAVAGLVGLAIALTIGVAMRSQLADLPSGGGAALLALTTVVCAGLFGVYFGIVHVLAPVVPWLRSVWRRWRGRCPDCGYTLHAQPVCPECGLPTGSVY